jgi:hypothetical protein
VNLFQQFGTLTGMAIVLVAIARPLVVPWLNERIRAGVDEGVKKRLAAIQLDLDKELERHRATLQIEADRARSAFARDTTDFAIYAQRRHDAIVGLFADFQKAERLMHLPTKFELTDQSVAEILRPRAGRAIRLVRDSYYRHVLYLPPELEGIATLTRHAFLTIYIGLTLRPDRVQGKEERDEALARLRARLTSFQNAARAELSRARNPLSPPDPYQKPYQLAATNDERPTV